MTKIPLSFSNILTSSDPLENPVLIVGQLHNLQQLDYDQVKVKLEPRVSKETFTAALANLHPAPTDSCSLWLNQATIAVLPSKCSRHNAPSRPHDLTKVVRSCASGGDEYIIMVCEDSCVFPSVCAIARAFPLYSRKSAPKPRHSVTVEFILAATDSRASPAMLSEADLAAMTDIAFGVRLAARLTDTPCAEMYTDVFVEEIKIVAEQLHVDLDLIQGDDLRDSGFGGIYSVGMAATHKPALAVLRHKPEGATKTIAWVGKGIVYDTGGLSMKTKSTLPGMKRDCGGAAAVLGAFYTTVKQGFSENLYAVICLAENAVGPDALRPDDVITLYSGRTVEVNNTDAEGRLLLGDGVAYACKDLGADIIIDVATLTGAQGIATGRYHAVMVTNNERWESFAVRAGKNSGDLVHPQIYCPELHFGEFASAVADMKNSSADRSNCEVSCAGLFIGSHIGFDYPGVWIHIDMAYPVYSGERSTGYGVALLLALFGHASSSALIQSVGTATNLEAVLDGTENRTDNGPQTSVSKKIRLA